ncbi:NUDIX domain-containing protein [Streptomyces sp. NPDC054796]
MPGGMAETNESPLAAGVRELAEELGAQVTATGLLCVEWVEPHGPWDDMIAFIFDGGTLHAPQAAHLAPQDAEVSEHRFFEVETGLSLLPARQRARAAHALRTLVLQRRLR